MCKYIMCLYCGCIIYASHIHTHKIRSYHHTILSHTIPLPCYMHIFRCVWANVGVRGCTGCGGTMCSNR
ncbi:hypothetical protein EON63_11590 [archaeon]|nr:MAG: hypothetical protein EON63_11590 [archaeon]